MNDHLQRRATVWLAPAETETTRLLARSLLGAALSSSIPTLPVHLVHQSWSTQQTPSSKLHLEKMLYINANTPLCDELPWATPTTTTTCIQQSPKPLRLEMLAAQASDIQPQKTNPTPHHTSRIPLNPTNN